MSLHGKSTNNAGGQFSEEERSIIDYLCSDNQETSKLDSILNKYSAQFLAASIHVDRREKTAEIKLPLTDTSEEAFSIIYQNASRIQLDLLGCLYLLGRLEADGFIILHSGWGRTPEEILLNPPVRAQREFPFPVSDRNVVDLLIKFSVNEIIPTPTLRRLRSNNFKTSEEKKFEKSMQATWTGITLAFLVGISNTVTSFFNKNSSENRLQEMTKVIENSHSALITASKSIAEKRTSSNSGDTHKEGNTLDKIEAINLHSSPIDLEPREIILQIQFYLNELGYDAGPEDGKLGVMTLKSIKKYQAAVNEEENGMPSLPFLERLKLASKVN